MCDEAIDQRINGGTQVIPQMLMRFEKWKTREVTENLNIIAVIDNGL